MVQVIIFIDPTVEAHVDFWRRHNPEAWSMVEAGAARATDRCAAATAPWGASARSIARLAMTSTAEADRGSSGRPDFCASRSNSLQTACWSAARWLLFNYTNIDCDLG